MSGHSHRVNSVCWNNDGTKLASGSADKTVKVWDTTTGECLWTLSGEKQIFSVAFSPDGSLIAAGGGGLFEAGTPIRLYNAATGDPFGSPLKGHNSGVSSLAFKPDDANVLITGSWDKTVKLWDLTAGAEAAAAAEWLRYWDADEQRHYYFHGASQATAWELPPGASWEDGDAESAAMGAGVDAGERVPGTCAPRASCA